MKTSLFKKEITKKEAGQVKAGDGTTREVLYIGMCPTSKYNIFLGYIPDSEYCSWTETEADPVLAPPQ
jgi:hypothetical protein